MEELACDVGDGILERGALGAHVDEHLSEMLRVANEEFVHCRRHVAVLNTSRSITLLIFAQQVSDYSDVIRVDPEIRDPLAALGDRIRKHVEGANHKNDPNQDEKRQQPDE